jgi:hypothetical protein
MVGAGEDITVSDDMCYGSDIGRLVDDYRADFVITAAGARYAARRRGSNGLPGGPEVQDVTCDGLAVKMDAYLRRSRVASRQEQSSCR